MPNPGALRPSFLSSVDYNSFMDKNNPQNNFSPETHDRNNGVGSSYGLGKALKTMEDKAKFFESMFR